MPKINLNALKKTFQNDVVVNTAVSLGNPDSSQSTLNTTKPSLKPRIHLSSLKENFNHNDPLNNSIKPLNIVNPIINHPKVTLDKTKIEIPLNKPTIINDNNTLNEHISIKEDIKPTLETEFKEAPKIIIETKNPLNQIKQIEKIEKKPEIIANNLLDEDIYKEDLFSNYKSETRRIEPAILEKIKKIGSIDYIKTNKKVLIPLLIIMIISVFIMFLSTTEYGFQKYKTSIIDLYNDKIDSPTGVNSNVFQISTGAIKTNTGNTVLKKTNTGTSIDTSKVVPGEISNTGAIKTNTGNTVLTKINTGTLIDTSKVVPGEISNGKITFITIEGYSFQVHKFVLNNKEAFIYKGKVYLSFNNLSTELKKELNY